MAEAGCRQLASAGLLLELVELDDVHCVQGVADGLRVRCFALLRGASAVAGQASVEGNRSEEG